MIKAAAIILAAGQATRYREADPSVASKVIAPLHGKPLVRHVASAALGSVARPVFVVTGHARTEVEEALDGLDVVFVHNRDFADGMATSLRAAIAALPDDVAGAVILLADMPGVPADFINRLVEAYSSEPDADAIVPVHDGEWGNPVLLGRPLLQVASQLDGDAGARKLMRQPGRKIVEIEANAFAMLDIDTPDILRKVDGGNR